MLFKSIHNRWKSIGLNGTIILVRISIACLLGEGKFLKTGNKNDILSSTKFEPNIMRSAFHKSYVKNLRKMLKKYIAQFNSYLLTEEKIFG